MPVAVGHSEAVYLELQNDFALSDVRIVLDEFPGVIVQDDPFNNVYPMPITCEGMDEVFVGRIRRDLSNPKGLHLWVVSDNLRKGAATNTIQIAEYLNSKGRWAYINLIFLPIPRFSTFYLLFYYFFFLLTL